MHYVMSNTKKKTVGQEVAQPIQEKKYIPIGRLFAIFLGSFLLAACCVWLITYIFNMNTISFMGKRSTQKNTDVSFTGDKLDPYMLVQFMDMKKNIIIADLRPATDYQKGHIKDAKSFSTKEFEAQYKKEHSVNKNTLVILYSDTQYSTDTSMLASRLKGKGYHVVPLAVGWNEWRHFPTFWVPESQWNSFSIDNYIEPRLDL